MTRSDRHRAGFTLIELLVAISILALIAVFSWRALDAIARTSDALTLSGDKIDNLARVLAALEGDAQRAENADLPAPGELRLLAPGGSVAYRVDNGILLRALSGAAPEAVATGVAGITVDLVRNARFSSQALNAALSLGTDTSGTAAPAAPAAPPAAGANAFATDASTVAGNKAVVTRVAGVRIALHMSDGNTVTRLLLLNGF